MSDISYKFFEISNHRYRFGGTDGERWFNDVWTYDPRTNTWTEQDCIGYIPAPREGHSAALVNDHMYIFGGRTSEGHDLGDLAAFRISTRRWYMFQNMGLSPSPRSGHSMTAWGKYIVILAGEPSTAPRDPGELSLSYLLDTSKIRYPGEQAGAPPQGIPVSQGSNVRKSSSIPQRGQGPRETAELTADGPRRSIAPRESAASPQYNQRSDAIPNIGAAGVMSKLPRVTSTHGPSGPPPQQQPPQLRPNGVPPANYAPRSRTPTRAGERGFGPTVNTVQAADASRVVGTGSPSTRDPNSRESPIVQRSESSTGFRAATPQGTRVISQRDVNGPSRSTSRSARRPSTPEDPRPSSEAQVRATSSQGDRPRDRSQDRPVEPVREVQPQKAVQSDSSSKELEDLRQRNAWYASELALARKAGYTPSSTLNSAIDESAVADDDRPLIEALLKMRAELTKVQSSIDAQSVSTANKVAAAEKQRDIAVSEAAFARAKLAAHGGSSGITDAPVSDEDRARFLNKRLAASLADHQQLSTQVEKLEAEIELERQARELAEESAEAAQKRVSELDLYKQRAAAEVESLKAELHDTQKIAREDSAALAEVQASSKLLGVDKSELSSKLEAATTEVKSQTAVLASLRLAVQTSSEKASMLESKLEDERRNREGVQEKLTQLRAEYEERSAELENVTRRLRDAEELAEKHAAEASSLRQATLGGLDKLARKNSNDASGTDERVNILQHQVETANAMVRKNRDAADAASEKLRRAEERIAGLEAYQEQASRDGLTTRRQLQGSMKELQSLQSEKIELVREIGREKLESNARLVQLRSVKELLQERGSSLDGLSKSRDGTPDLPRVRELESQLEASLRSHEELKETFTQREREVSKEWEDKLTNLDNDYQAAVKYVKGTEKMLRGLKNELQRYKSTINDLEKDNAAKDKVLESSRGWESERDTLRSEISSLEKNASESAAQLESQLKKVQAELESARKEHEALRTSSEQRQRQFEEATEAARVDLDNVKQENLSLEARARDAEEKVQLLLDQVESSVDAYRRQSLAGNARNGSIRRRRESASGASLYSAGDAGTETSENEDDDSNGTNRVGANGGGGSSGHVRDASGSIVSDNGTVRNSLALDSLASELETLRTHWETTNKSYRLSDRFDFERTPTSPQSGGALSDSLANWRRKLELQEQQQQQQHKLQGGSGGVGGAVGGGKPLAEAAGDYGGANSGPGMAAATTAAAVGTRGDGFNDIDAVMARESNGLSSDLRKGSGATIQANAVMGNTTPTQAPTAVQSSTKA